MSAHQNYPLFLGKIPLGTCMVYLSVIFVKYVKIPPARRILHVIFLRQMSACSQNWSFLKKTPQMRYSV